MIVSDIIHTGTIITIKDILFQYIDIFSEGIINCDDAPQGA